MTGIAVEKDDTCVDTSKYLQNCRDFIVDSREEASQEEDDLIPPELTTSYVPPQIWDIKDAAKCLSWNMEIVRMDLGGSEFKEEYIKEFKNLRFAIDMPSEPIDRISTKEDISNDEEHNIKLLEMTAKTGDEKYFVDMIRQINWDKMSANNFIYAVHLALSAGANLAARVLAKQGAQKYFDNAELEKLAYVLSPPQIVKTNIPPDPSVRENQAWLCANADEFRGQWVAIKNGKLIAVAQTAREIKSKIRSNDNVMITQVL